MKEKKERKKWGLIVFLVFIMVGTSFSFVFFGFSPVSEKIDYKGIKFTNNNEIWIAKISNKEAAFTFLPGDVEKIPAFSDFSGALQNKLEIDVTYDLNNTNKESIALAQHQLGLTLAKYNIFVRKGFTSNNTFNIPIIACKDSTPSIPVIYFRSGNTTNIGKKESCIIAEAKTGAEFIMVKDRILYGMLGVIK